MNNTLIARPEQGEAASYYSTYMDQVPDGDILSILESQLDSVAGYARGISEDRSLYRYAPEKWSIREVLSHVNDTERVFTFRTLWFARGFDSPLPSFDQDIAVKGAAADQISWARHADEFRTIRGASLALFRNLPDDGWMRKGIASDNPFTVRALAYITAGHVAHHLAILNERYK